MDCDTELDNLLHEVLSKKIRVPKQKKYAFEAESDEDTTPDLSTVKQEECTDSEEDARNGSKYDDVPSSKKGYNTAYGRKEMQSFLESIEAEIKDESDDEMKEEESEAEIKEESDSEQEEANKYGITAKRATDKANLKKNRKASSDQISQQGKNSKENDKKKASNTKNALKNGAKIAEKDKISDGQAKQKGGNNAVKRKKKAASSQESTENEDENTEEYQVDDDVQGVKRKRRTSSEEEEQDVKIESASESSAAADSDSADKPRKKKLSAKQRIRAKKERIRQAGDEYITQSQTAKEATCMANVFVGKTEFVERLHKTAARERTGHKGGADAEAEEKVRAVAWQDSDDEDVEDDANVKRNKYTREQGTLTNERRRKQFEQIVGKPKWAELDRERASSDSEDEIMRRVGHVVKGGNASQGLPKGMIELKTLKKLNRETKTEGAITSINFHPTSMVAMMAGKSGMVSIVAVDGVRNEKLHTIGLDNFRTSCVQLSPDGNEAIFGCYRKFFHVFNLLTGQCDALRVPPRDTWCMHNFRVSPCGKYIATAGLAGEVHLLSRLGKEVLQTIQLRYTCQALAFTPDSKYLLCHSNDTEISVYGMKEKRLVNVLTDQGCVNGATIAVSPNGQYVATGTRQGIANIYALDDILKQKNPVPLKTIENLTTYIDSLTFNATSELLALASSNVPNAIKLVHVQSGTVFRNFPYVTGDGLGFVTTVQFSPSGGYLAVGTKKSVVHLFRVKHYPNY